MSGIRSGPIAMQLGSGALPGARLDRRRVANAAAGLALGVAGFVFVAWVFRMSIGLDFLALWLMKANTAFCIAATSVAVLLLVNQRPDGPARLRRVLGALVVAITAATLFEYASGRDLGLDQLAAVDPSPSLPGRMSSWTAAILALLALTIVLHGSRLDRAADVALIGAGVALQLVWAGHLYRVLPLYGVDRSTLVSPQTLVCVSLLTLALIAARLGRGVFAIASRASAGGSLVRVLVPIAWLLPLLLGGLRLFAQRNGIIGSTTMGVAIFAVANTVLMTALIYGFACHVDAAERRYVEERERREELERFVAICAWTGRVRWNGEWVRIERYLLDRFGVEVTHTISDEAMACLSEEGESPPGGW